ncbi:MAG TPA: hypothetical protein VFE03_03450 [Caulobacteraceae bacterium]|jgi:hypothetical protein|nr:hypothetical protein [Caulobacteraceae bacterium]
MRLVEFAGAKGAAVWISCEQVIYVNRPDTSDGGGSLYGSSNGATGARIWLSGGAHLDVRQSLEEVVALLAE